MKVFVSAFGLFMAANNAFGICTVETAKEKALDAAKQIDLISYSYDDDVSAKVRKTDKEETQWVFSTVINKPGQLGGTTWTVTVGNKNCFIYEVKMGVSEEAPGGK